MDVVRNVLIQANLGSVRLILEADQGRKSLIYKGCDVCLKIFEPVGREFARIKAPQTPMASRKGEEFGASQIRNQSCISRADRTVIARPEGLTGC